MNSVKTGALIRALRTEQGMTQHQLAEKLHISDRTVSKWETGRGWPDPSLWEGLSAILEVNVEEILKGELTANQFVGGNMKQASYYVCPICGNLSVCTGKATVSCCGRKLQALAPVKAAPEKKLQVEQIEDDWYITSDHPMEKDNYISFVAFATGDRIFLLKQYPEWNLQVRFQRRGHGTLLWHSTTKGLFYQLI